MDTPPRGEPSPRGRGGSPFLNKGATPPWARVCGRSPAVPSLFSPLPEETHPLNGQAWTAFFFGVGAERIPAGWTNGAATLEAIKGVLIISLTSTINTVFWSKNLERNYDKNLQNWGVQASAVRRLGSEETRTVGASSSGERVSPETLPSTDTCAIRLSLSSSFQCPFAFVR